MERYEHAFYRPLVSNWQNYENWQLGGGRDATQRATDIWKQALKEYQEPAMDPAIREASGRLRRTAAARRSAAKNPELVTSARTDRSRSTAVSWYVLIAMLIVFTLSIADRYVISTVLEPIRLELHLSDSGVAFLTGASLALFYVTFGFRSRGWSIAAIDATSSPPRCCSGRQ